MGEAVAGFMALLFVGLLLIVAAVYLMEAVAGWFGIEVTHDDEDE